MVAEVATLSGRMILAAVILLAGCIAARPLVMAAGTEQPSTGGILTWDVAGPGIAAAVRQARAKTGQLTAAAQQAPGAAGATKGGGSLAAGVTIPIRRMEIEQVFASIGVDAVYFATMQSGNTRIVTSGTITEAGQQQYSYAAKPDDRLRIKFASGQIIEYRFGDFQGDYSQPDGSRFLRNNHFLRFRFKSSWGTNVVVRMRREGRQYVNTVKGQVTDGPTRYDVSTTTQGTIFTDVGGSGAEYDSREEVSGTAVAADLKVAIHEQFRYHMVVFDHAVEDVTHNIANVWQSGSERYELPDGHIFRTFKDGTANELDSWRATGVLSRNGQPVGQLIQRQNLGRIETLLKTGDSEALLYSDVMR